MRWGPLSLSALVACAGLVSACDGVFGLVRISDDDGGGDSVSDAAEPCPFLDHDEDGDGMDDGCDPCPFDVNNDGDVDNDGIADACDPDSTVKNRVLLFSGFGPNNLGGLLPLGQGHWGADTFVTTTSGQCALLWNSGPDHAWVMTRISVSALTNSSIHEAGIMFDALTPGNPVSGTACVLGYDGGNYVRILNRDQTTDTTILRDSNTPVALANFSGMVRASYDRPGAPMTSCSFSAGGPEGQIASATPTRPPGAIALYVINAAVTFQFLFVVSKP